MNSRALASDSVCSSELRKRFHVDSKVQPTLAALSQRNMMDEFQNRVRAMNDCLLRVRATAAAEEKPAADTTLQFIWSPVGLSTSALKVFLSPVLVGGVFLLLLHLLSEKPLLPRAVLRINSLFPAKDSSSQNIITQEIQFRY